ncbi:MAG: c-type cytochrome [Nitrospirota bacterium]|jgi:nitric oxide reductase subunit C
MSTKALRNLFIFGSLFFFVVFLGLTFDTMKKLDERAPEITEEVNQGKMLWHKYDCIGCHTILGNGSYFAPDLTKRTVGKPRGYLKRFLMDPRGVNAAAAMPNLGITEDEAEKLIAFLDWTSKVDTNDWPPEPVLASMMKARSKGVEVYQENGCSACHMIGGVGGTSGPPLDRAGAKHDRQWHVEHLMDPQSVVPNSAMPAYGHLGQAEIDALADYMMSLK